MWSRYEGEGYRGECDNIMFLHNTISYWALILIVLKYRLSACLAVWLPVCLSGCLSVCLSVCLAVCLSGCLSVWLSVWLPVCLKMVSSYFTPLIAERQHPSWLWLPPCPVFPFQWLGVHQLLPAKNTKQMCCMTTGEEPTFLVKKIPGIFARKSNMPRNLPKKFDNMSQMICQEKIPSIS